MFLLASLPPSPPPTHSPIGRCCNWTPPTSCLQFEGEIQQSRKSTHSQCLHIRDDVSLYKPFHPCCVGQWTNMRHLKLIMMSNHLQKYQIYGSLFIDIYFELRGALKCENSLWMSKRAYNLPKMLRPPTHPKKHLKRRKTTLVVNRGVDVHNTN